MYGVSPFPAQTRPVYTHRRPGGVCWDEGEHSAVPAGCLSVEVNARAGGYVVRQGPGWGRLGSRGSWQGSRGVRALAPLCPRRFSGCRALTVRRVKSSLTRSFPCGVNAAVASVAAARRWLRGGRVVGCALRCLLPSARGAEILSRFCALLGAGGVTAPFVISQAFLFVLLCFSRPADRVCSLKVCALPCPAAWEGRLTREHRPAVQSAL